MDDTGTTAEQNEAELERLALEDTKLAADIDAFTERREAIKAILLNALPVGTHHAGVFKIQVRAGARRLDTSALEQAYPVAAHPGLYTARPDTAKVKNHIAPVDLEAFYQVGQPTVVIT